MVALRWGIAGAGKICHDFVTAVGTLPTTDHQVMGVAARQLDRAQQFATKHGIPNAYQGYQALAQDPNVDVVYVGVLNPQHLEVASMMLEHGKHVLCEKPLTMNVKQSRVLVELARAKRLFLMEAIWSRTFPVYKELRRQLDAGVIGDVKHVNVGFGFPLSNVDRLGAKELGGGTILDLGVYVLQFQQFVYGGAKPVKVVATGHLNEYGTDDSVGAVLAYSDGRLANVQTDATVQLSNTAVVTGTKGIISIPQFWCPTKIILPSETKEFALPTTAKFPFNFINSAGLSYEAEEVRQCIAKGQIESPVVTWNDSLQLAELMDTLRHKVGVIYPQDNA